MTPDAWIADPAARLQVWKVRVELVWDDAGCGDGVDGLQVIPPPIRCPAYTAGEAVQFAAVHSGIPRADWSRYVFIPEPMRVTP